MKWKSLNQKYYQITAKGLTLPSDNSSPLPSCEEVEICKVFIAKWIDRWDRPNVKFNSQRLANAVGIHNNSISICKGSFIQAMLDSGYKMYACWWSEHDVIFNADYRRVENYWQDQGIEIPV